MRNPVQPTSISHKLRRNTYMEQKSRKHGKGKSHRAHFSQQFPDYLKPCTCKRFSISCPKFVAGVHAEDMLDVVSMQVSSSPSVRQVNLQFWSAVARRRLAWNSGVATGVPQTWHISRFVRVILSQLPC